MNKAIKAARAKVRSPVECHGQIVEQIIGTDRNMRFIFTDQTQLILKSDITVNFNPTPTELIDYGLLDKSYRVEVLRNALLAEKKQYEQALKQIEGELHDLS